MEPADELVVVDDASTDASADVARAAGARVVRLGGNSGAAAARNAGVRETSVGDVLLFVDADVVIAADVVARVRATFAARPEIAALFGSYDDRPRAGGIVSPYRNLLHHYVHQHGATEAFTFWAGCGAVRRAAFTGVGGFDERAWRRAIEDIELGYRLRAAGHRIVLDPTLQCTHLKRWTIRSMFWTDLTMRAIPWTRLMLETPAAGSDLNLTRAQRISVALGGVGLGLCTLAIARPALLVPGITALAGVVFLNRAFYAYLAERRGLAFALASVPLHLLYFVCSGLGYAWANLTHALGTRPAGR